MLIGDEILQPTVSLLTTKAECRNLKEATKDIQHFKRLLFELQVDTSSPTPLFSDNQSCIKIALDLIFYARTKYIEIQYHFIREKIKSREVNVDYIPTFVQQANFLTKPLAFRPFF
jgi:hypothetical protein